jgi:hypothetical protein
MAKLEIIGGEIPLGKWDTSYAFSDVFPEIVTFHDGKFKKADLNQIDTLEIVDQEQVKSIAAGAGWGIAAGLVAGIFTGGLGLIAGGVAGAMAKSSKTEVTFLASFKDGRRFIATTDPKTWKKIQAILITPSEKRKLANIALTQKLLPA